MSLTQRKIAATLCTTLLITGCSSASKDISATYVSPIQYQQYDCEQLSAEANRLGVRANQLAGRLDEAASNDQALVGVGMVLFWPALFALGGTKEQEAEFARLRGEYDAVQQASIAQKCEPAIPTIKIESKKPEEENKPTPSPSGYPT